MKRYVYAGFLFLFFTVCLIFSRETFGGAGQGLMLWYETVLPTLFPFMVLTGLLVDTEALGIISSMLKPFLGRVFHISDTACFAVLGGFVCGYPMGAKITGDLLEKGEIDLKEGAYLLSFCNNVSPAFITGFVVTKSLDNPGLLLPSMLILVISPILASFFFRKFYIDYHEHIKNIPERRKKNKSDFSAVLDKCLTQSCEAMIKIGGYMMLFSVLIKIGQLLPSHPLIWKEIALSSLEITNGITLLTSTIRNSALRYVLVMGLTSFGGVCAVFQTQCMVQRFRLSMRIYAIEKLITAMITSFLALVYILLIR